MNPSEEIKDRQLHVNFYILNNKTNSSKKKEAIVKTYVEESAWDNFSRTTSPLGLMVYIRVTGIPTAV
jgi:hypothetical protein